MSLKLAVGKHYVDNIGFSHLIIDEVQTSDDFGIYKELSDNFYRSESGYYLPNGEHIFGKFNSKLNLLKEVTISTYTVYCLWGGSILEHKVNACSEQEVLLLAPSKCIDNRLIIKISKS